MQTSHTGSVRNNIIVLTLKENANQPANQTQQNKVMIKGQVLDTNGIPIIGANIIEVGVPGNGTIPTTMVIFHSM